MRIFFACSMRGGFSNVKQDLLRKVPEIIRGLGHTLVSDHQTNPNFLKSESSFSANEIYERDYQWLKECDAVIAEISNPSLGVGAEIAEARSLGKPVACFYKNDLEEKVSAYIRGMESIEVSSYASMSDLKNKVADFVNLL